MLLDNKSHPAALGFNHLVPTTLRYTCTNAVIMKTNVWSANWRGCETQDHKGKHSHSFLFMAPFELIYPSLSHFPRLSSYKLHRLSLTWECSQAFPWWRHSNGALWVTWQRAGGSGGCCVLLPWIWRRCTLLGQIRTPEDNNQIPYAAGKLPGSFGWIGSASISNLCSQPQKQTEHKNFQMTENMNKQIDNGFLGWPLANGV